MGRLYQSAASGALPCGVIVTPALADANNGNWHTARRWQQHLAGAHPVRIVREWPDAAADDDRFMIALHARRSAPSIAAWHAARGDAGLALVLTGTDLYRDIGIDATARRSLDLARVLVVLQEMGITALPESFRAKARVIFQSCTARQSLAKPQGRVRCVMVGHLRDEKSPQTLFAAAGLLARRDDVFIDHIGAALDPAFAPAAQATMRANPRYRWLGALPREDARRRIQRAHLLLHCSRMEGGAHVLMEAITSGTPVLASRIDGNVGMLGTDYAGCFEWNDASALASLIARCEDERAAPDGGLLARLANQCARRAPLFAPAHERAAVRTLATDLLQSSPHP